MQTIYDILSQRKSHLNRPSEIVSVNTSVSLETSLQILEDTKLNALLVKNEQNYIGFLSLFDIMHYVAFEPVFGNRSDEAEIKDELLDHTVADVLAFNPRSTNLTILQPQEPLNCIFNVLSKSPRALVVMDSREDILTQTDLFHFAFCHQELFPEEFWRTKAQEFLQTRSTKSSKLTDVGHAIILDKTHAITGFKRMYTHQLDEVAITNENGHLISSLGANDLKGLSKEKIDMLHRPVLLYLKSISKNSHEANVCSPSSSMKQLVERMLNYNTHQIWVVGENDQVKAFITMSDILEHIGEIL